jgi:peptidoglycan/LPS O-acetylase OafA/YrhL
MPEHLTDPPRSAESALLPVEDGPRPRSAAASPAPAPAPAPAGYLTMFDFFRVVVCACVLGQHSFLWTDMANNDIGTGFITMLHYTRNAFFFLTAVVVCYAQVTRPRSVVRFWIRRYIQIGVPYLAWTAIYVVFTILRPGGAWGQARSLFWSDLRLGYYQLYVIVVLFQFYLVFPFLLNLLQVTSTRVHVALLALSIAIALFIGVDLHFNPHIGIVGHDVHQIGNDWVWSRNLISYQAYFIAGVLVAFHFERVVGFVRRNYRSIVWASGLFGLGTLLWYVHTVDTGSTAASASDIYEPIAVAWSFAAIAAICALGCRWADRRALVAGVAGVAGVGGVAGVDGAGSPSGAGSAGAALGAWIRAWATRLRRPSITYLAELTGGFYLCHILFINMIRAILYSHLVGGAHLPWPIRTAIFYLGTLVVAVTFVSLILRTPLRWVIGGPVRAEQRVRDNAEVARRRGEFGGDGVGVGPAGAGAGVAGAGVAGAGREGAGPLSPEPLVAHGSTGPGGTGS